MEILEAYDLTGSFRAAAKLAGCDHHTVARYVRLRDEGRPVEQVRAERLADRFLVKIEEWVERSQGQIGADVAHGKLVAMGYGGSERTTRRAVAVAKRAWRAGNRRVYRPWIPEPGLWVQWDWGQGPRSLAGGRCCGVRGLGGRGSGWCCRPPIGPCRRCWPVWIRRCGGLVGCRPTR